jgi:hypothetical protein
MSFEEVLSDRDSEGEIDDDVVDLEERTVKFYYLSNILLHMHIIYADCYVKQSPAQFIFAA